MAHQCNALSLGETRVKINTFVKSQLACIWAPFMEKSTFISWILNHFSLFFSSFPDDINAVLNWVTNIRRSTSLLSITDSIDTVKEAWKMGKHFPYANTCQTKTLLWLYFFSQFYEIAPCKMYVNWCSFFFFILLP